VFDPHRFSRDFIYEIAQPMNAAEEYQREFRSVLRFNPRDAEGRGQIKVIPRSSVVLTFYSGIGETPTVTVRTQGAGLSELADGILEAVEQGAPIPHYFGVHGAERPEVFICASEQQSATELMHWAHALISACAKQGVHAQIVAAECVQATETFTRPTRGAVAHPSGTYVRVVASKATTPPPLGGHE
jgi:hypothetical protein